MNAPLPHIPATPGFVQRLDPPRLASSGPLGSLTAFRSDPLALATRARAERGDVVELRLGPERLVAVFAPDDVKRVLVDNHGNYDKRTHGYDLLRGTLGNGARGSAPSTPTFRSARARASA